MVNNMFKTERVEPTPTLRQFVKSLPKDFEDGEAEVVVIFLTEEWLNITFGTDDFRYAVKYPTKEDYNEAADFLQETFGYKLPVKAYVAFDRLGWADLRFVTLPEEAVEKTCFIQFEWGFGRVALAERKTPPGKKPASKAKSS